MRMGREAEGRSTKSHETALNKKPHQIGRKWPRIYADEKDPNIFHLSFVSFFEVLRSFLYVLSR